MSKIYVDSETVGLHGFAIIIQYSYENDDQINIYEIWKEPVHKTLALIEEIVKHTFVGFNISFDLFHLCKVYTTWKLLPSDWIPEEHINEIPYYEKLARDGPCLKPAGALDLMLYARKTAYQSTMKQEPIRIKKIPTQLVYLVVAELEKRIHLPDIYFARRKDRFRNQWEVFDVFDEDDNLDPRFKDIVLNFDASTALKNLIQDALKIETTKFGDISLPKAMNPEELGYAPYALALGTKQDWKGTWPSVIKFHIAHWANNREARQYASDDVKYLKLLENYFGNPEPSDDDSTLACMVATCRWRGYAVDLNRIKKLRVKALERVGSVDTYFQRVKDSLERVLSPTELISLKDKNNESLKTGKIVLEKIAKFTVNCPECDGHGCNVCKNKGEKLSEAAHVAKNIIDAREAKKEVELYDKLLISDRLHADFVVIGTLSSRMSGTGGLNTQGIKKEKKVRRAFTLANKGYILCGGDFKSFEVVLAIAVYNDPDLLKDVTTPRVCYKCNGTKVTTVCSKCYGKGVIKTEDADENEVIVECTKCNGTCVTNEEKCFICKGTGEVETKIHALFGQQIFPTMSYEQILESEGTDDDKYTASKSGLFSQLYGGTEHTLAERLGVPVDVALEGSKRFDDTYKQVGVQRQKIINMFCSMRQPNGIGSKVEWHEPADYIAEPVTGHRRYYTLQNKICKSLFDMAEKPPEQILTAGAKFEIVRRDRIQKGSGAVRSALFASAFALQAANMRSAANHVIQSQGAVITKRLQRNIWDLQPAGINEFVVQPLNIHDEVLCPTLPNYVDKVADIVNVTINYFKKQVPLLAIGWHKTMSSWAEK